MSIFCQPSLYKVWCQILLCNLAAYLEPCKTSKMKFSAKIVNGWKSFVDYCCKKLQLRCLTGFWIHLCSYSNCLINHSNKFQARQFSKSLNLLKINSRNTRTRCEICSELTIKTPKRRHCCRFADFIVNFTQILNLLLLFPLLTWNM